MPESTPAHPPSLAREEAAPYHGAVTTPKLPARVEPARGALVPASSAPMDASQRWRLIRDLLVFQFKLVVDGLKDVVLGPLSIAAGVLDLARGTPESRSWFRAILRSGARFDRWVGLFEGAESELAALEGGGLPAAPAHRPSAPSHARPADPSLDEYLARLERLLVTHHKRGGLSASAKQAVDRALDMIEAQSVQRPGENTDGRAQQE